MIKLSGGEPANFLDVGGSANAQTVEAGFRIILKDPQGESHSHQPSIYSVALFAATGLPKV